MRVQSTPFVKIPLTRRKTALVSLEDAERVLQHAWQAYLLIRNGRRYWRAQTTITIAGKRVTVLLHRFVLSVAESSVQVDHKNGNTLDCRRGNVREATREQNAQNRRKTGKQPYRGIQPHHSRWRCSINANGKRENIGVFDTAEEAARAYDEAARLLHGDFACVNFPRNGERKAW